MRAYDVCDALRAFGSLNAYELTDIAMIEPRALQCVLYNLQRQGRIERSGERPFSRYSLTDCGTNVLVLETRMMMELPQLLAIRPMKTRMIAARYGLNSQQVRVVLQDLRAKGIIVSEGPAGRTVWRAAEGAKA